MKWIDLPIKENKLEYDFRILYIYIYINSI